MITREVRDPEAQNITVTRVHMTRDLKQARVYFRTQAATSSRQQVYRALRRARPFLKKQLGKRLRLRNVPELTFLHDDSMDQQDRVAQLLDQIAEAASSGPDDHEPKEL